jgi:hypothetical protein
MQRDARAVQAPGLALFLDRFVCARNLVLVRVIEGGREQDAFQASAPDTLRDSLRPIYRRLDSARQAVEFSGIEERWLPGGFRHTVDHVSLGDLTAALAFLGGYGSRSR